MESDDDTFTLETVTNTKGKVPEAAPPRAPPAPTPAVAPVTTPVTITTEPETTEASGRPSRHKSVPQRLGIEDKYAAAVEVVEDCPYVGCDPSEPVTMREAMTSPDAAKWKVAAEEEIQSLLEHDTWTLTRVTCWRSLLGSKRVLKKKFNSEREVDRYKWLMAQGFLSSPGLTTRRHQ